MKKMKQLCILLGLLFIPLISLGNVELSKSQLDAQINQGNVLSDSFSTNNECTTIKTKYNKDFSGYARSDCFSYNGKYYYLICDASNSCSITNTNQVTTSNTVTTTTTNVPYKEKLDAFLVKVSQMRTDFNNDTKYETLLNSLDKQLLLFSEKYRSNTTISEMITYLSAGVKNLQSQLTANIDVDNFLCQLLGNCGENTSTNTNTTNNTNTNTNTTTSPQACTGTLPPTGNGVNVRPFTNVVAGPDTNTTWKYSNGGGRCTWDCKTGYTLNAAKNNCEAKAAGSGLTVYVYDNSTQQPMSGVGVDIIGVIGMSTSVIGAYTTDSSGKTTETFESASGMGNILQIKKSGYSIASASGCTPRVTSGNLYCDSVKMENSVVKIYLQNGTTPTPTTKIGNSMSNLSSSACVNQTWYAVLDGVDKSNPPKGCARLAGTSACTNASDFRDYTSSEWSGNNRIITSGQANQFPVGNYEFFALYGSQIMSAGSASLASCGSTPTPHTQIGNSISSLSSSACVNQTWYAVLDGVDKSNPPKGCARLAGTSACTNASDFRDYTASEWSGNNRIITSGQANQFPVGNYEFFALYGSQIMSAGSASLASCSANTSTGNSCKWQYHAVFGPVGVTDIDPNTTACSSSLNGRSAYEVGTSRQKVATCTCS